jgi:hypothetical protein
VDEIPVIIGGAQKDSYTLLIKCDLRELLLPGVGALKTRELVLPRVGALKIRELVLPRVGDLKTWELVLPRVGALKKGIFVS